MPKFDFGAGTTIELTEIQFLMALLKLSELCRGMALSLSTNHASALADFSGTRYRPAMKQILAQVNAIIPEIGDASLRGAFHSISKNLLRLSEIDEQVVQIEAQTIGFRLTGMAAERKKLEKRLSRNRMQFLSQRMPDALKALSIESANVLSSIGDEVQIVEERVSRLSRSASESTLPIEVTPSDKPPSVSQPGLNKPNEYPPVDGGLEQADLGDQRAKDLIDEADAETDPKRIIYLLQKALRYGRTGIQASKAYLGIAMAYEDSGDDTRAIRYYTKSIETPRSGQPDPIAVFWRGRIHLRRRALDKARLDMAQALALGLTSPEREEADRSLAEIAALAGNG